MAIKVKVPRSDIVPSLVLKGRVKRYLPVRTIFINTCMREILFRLYDSYWERSHLDDKPNLDGDHSKPGFEWKMGRPDDIGEKWKQLAPTTYYIKQGVYEEGSYKDFITQSRSRAAQDVAAKLEYLDPKIKAVDGDGINIRTGRLLAACYPGPLVNGRLVVGKDQKIKTTRTGITFDFSGELNYVDELEKLGRPLITDDHVAVWTQDAVQTALEEAERRYLELKDRYREIDRRRSERRRKLREIRRRQA